MARIVILIVVVAVALGWWFLSADESEKLPDSVDPIAESQQIEARRRTPSYQAKPSAASVDDVETPQGSPTSQPSTDDLEILIVDHLHQPLVDFPIAFCPNLNLLHKKGHDQCELRRTDALGRVVMKDFRRILSESKEAPWYLVHDVQFEEPPHLRLDSVALKGNSNVVIKSVQPPFGSIEVRAVEADSTPGVDVGRAEISIVRPEEVRDPTLVWSRESWSAPYKNGRAHFPYVQLDRRWSASAYRKGSQVPSNSEDPGPEYHGDLRVFSVTLGLDHPVAVFRAVIEHNVPLANTTLNVTLSRSYGGSSELVVTTDADGKFRVDCMKKTLFGGRFIKVRWQSRKTAISGSAKISERMKDGVNDCGDVVLRADGPLVSGRAFDASGSPLPFLRISAGENVSFTGSGNPGFPSSQQFVRAKTDKDGFFRLHGEIPSEEFFVWADDDDVRSPGVNVKRGQSDVRLECYAVCTPEVTVLLGPGAKWNGLRVRLRNAGSDEEGDGYARASQSGQTITAVMNPVAAGLYDLVWIYHGRPMGSKLGLSITKSGTIATIDLRDVLHAFPLNLERADQAPLTEVSGVVRWRATASDYRWQSFAIRGAKTILSSDASAVDVQVLAAGYRRVSIKGLTGPRTVVLQPGVRVRFILKTDGILPSHPYVFDPYPMVGHKLVGKAIGSPYFTDKNREVTFLLPPGPVVIGWHLERREKNGAVGSTVLRRHNVEIEVAEGVAEQVFELKLAAKALESLMKNPPY